MVYCMYNAHADISRMVDENGELAEKYYYDEWGVETETLRYGDITGDGEVNINDYSLMKRLILLSDTELTVEQKIIMERMQNHVLIAG